MATGFLAQNQDLGLWRTFASVSGNPNAIAVRASDTLEPLKLSFIPQPAYDYGAYKICLTDDRSRCATPGLRIDQIISTNRARLPNILLFDTPTADIKECTYLVTAVR